MRDDRVAHGEHKPPVPNVLTIYFVGTLGIFVAGISAKLMAVPPHRQVAVVMPTALEANATASG